MSKLRDLQTECEGTPAALARGLCPNAPAVRFNDVPRDRQPNARAAARIARTGFIHAVEAGEDIGKMFLWNTNTVIFDGNVNFISMLHC